METILLTNDDGYSSPGLMYLREKLNKDYRVITVAPSRERSAVSMALTLNRPLRVETIEKDFYYIDGTPSDCINIAMRKLLDSLPFLVVSGMNLGENLSEDILYSGTVGGAISGFFYGVPSLAVSLISPGKKYVSLGYDHKKGSEITKKVIDNSFAKKKLKGIFNMNIPPDTNGKVIITTLGNKRYTPNIIERIDPRGRKYYWIGTGDPVREGAKGTDIWAVENGYVSLSPLKYDLSCFETVNEIKNYFDKI